MIRNTLMLWTIIIGFPVILYVFNQVGVYILGFAIVVFIYSAIWALWNRRK